MSDYYQKGAVQLNSVGNITVSNCSFVNNSATGLLVYDSSVVFSGYNTIRGNKGYSGGGMALNAGSNIEFSPETTLLLEDNMAENKGGGLLVQGVYEEIDGDTYCFFMLTNLFPFISAIIQQRLQVTIGMVEIYTVIMRVVFLVGKSL